MVGADVRSAFDINSDIWAQPAFQLNWAVSRSPLHGKVLQFTCILGSNDPREFILFVGASAQLAGTKKKRRLSPPA